MLLSLLYLAVRRLLRLLTWVVIVTMLPAMLSCWSCAISCACSDEVIACRFGVGIESSLRRRAGSCHANGGGASRSPRRPYYAGTASS